MSKLEIEVGGGLRHEGISFKNTPKLKKKSIFAFKVDISSSLTSRNKCLQFRQHLSCGFRPRLRFVKGLSENKYGVFRPGSGSNRLHVTGLLLLYVET